MALVARRPAPITIDTVVTLLERTLCSTPVSTAISFILYFRPETLTDRQRALLTAFSRFLSVRRAHQILTRLVMNNGWFRRDRPRWETEVVLVTGGGGDIGSQIVVEMLNRCKRVAVLDLVLPKHRISGASYYKCDVTSPESVKTAAQLVRMELGDPTIVINNAGVLHARTLFDTTDEQFLFQYKVNVIGPLNIIKEFVPHLVKLNHGHVVTVASSAAYLTIPQLGAYSASKSAALVLHESLSQELVHRYKAPRVRTTVVCPTKVAGTLGSALSATPNPFFSPVLEPWQVAVRIAKSVDSGLSDHITMPLFASCVLPSLRAVPEYMRSLLMVVSKQKSAIDDDRADKAWAARPRPESEKEKEL